MAWITFIVYALVIGVGARVSATSLIVNAYFATTTLGDEPIALFSPPALPALLPIAPSSSSPSSPSPSPVSSLSPSSHSPPT